MVGTLVWFEESAGCEWWETEALKSLICFSTLLVQLSSNCATMQIGSSLLESVSLTSLCGSFSVLMASALEFATFECLHADFE